MYFNSKEVQVLPFFAYESAIPQFDDKNKAFKPPLGHVIVFFQVKLGVTAQNIILKLEPDEVDSCIWLNYTYL